MVHFWCHKVFVFFSVILLLHYSVIVCWSKMQSPSSSITRRTRQGPNSKTKTDLGCYNNTWYNATKNDKIGLAKCFVVKHLYCLLKSASSECKKELRRQVRTTLPLCWQPPSCTTGSPFQYLCAGDEMNPGPLDGRLPALSVGTTSSLSLWTAEWKAVLGTK